MIIARISKTLFGLLVVTLLSFPGLAFAEENRLEVDEKRLDTDDSSRQYHHLVINPYEMTLDHPGFIVGIEKSNKTSIGYPNAIKRERDADRLRLWEPSNGPNGKVHTRARNYHIDRVFNDRKSMYISHILDYAPQNDGGPTSVSPAYLIYRDTGFGAEEDNSKCPNIRIAAKKEYPNSWRALDCLFKLIDNRMAKASPQFTHLFIMSMGWNNNQTESLRRYNLILDHLKASARDDDQSGGRRFRPLVVGLTWPSVWGGTAVSDLINKVTHIGSYVNKADDADEIGYGYANYLINNVVPRLAHKHQFSTTIIAHSFGARILSRAYLSGHLLVDQPPADASRKQSVLMINLQGAFSARRFNEHKTQPLYKRPFHRGEGAPYALHRTVPGKFVMTWSAKDTANPAARFLSGASHVGGKPGYKELKDNTAEEFEYLKPTSVNAPIPNCEHKRASQNVLMVDMTEFVEDHNDILERKMGEFLWQNLKCFDYR